MGEEGGDLWDLTAPPSGLDDDNRIMKTRLTGFT